MMSAVLRALQGPAAQVGVGEGDVARNKKDRRSMEGEERTQHFHLFFILHWSFHDVTDGPHSKKENNIHTSTWYPFRVDQKIQLASLFE